MDDSSYKLNFDPDKKDEIYHDYSLKERTSLIKIAELGCKML
jgi:hypothetical protein